MSSRQQVKFLMQKTQQEENWDMDNDSELRGGSESSEDENVMIKQYLNNDSLWRASYSLDQPIIMR